MIICASLTTQAHENSEALRLCDLALNGCDKALSKAKSHIETQDSLIAAQDDYIDKLDVAKARSDNKVREWERKAPYIASGLFILGILVGGARK